MEAVKDPNDLAAEVAKASGTILFPVRAVRLANAAHRVVRWQRTG